MAVRGTRLCAGRQRAAAQRARLIEIPMIIDINTVPHSPGAEEEDSRHATGPG
ncbi:hypothetical protein [Nonomuraea sp. 10N515B]|uniref:hypothetical protein n=1 Tax=Nonomuraea sp. 10N515B TaxID=3457422 RepID=UPI003FCC4EDC